jgi:hypothetical protein
MRTEGQCSCPGDLGCTYALHCFGQSNLSPERQLLKNKETKTLKQRRAWISIFLKSLDSLGRFNLEEKPDNITIGVTKSF